MAQRFIFFRLFFLPLSLLFAAVLTGCGIGPVSTSLSTGAVAISGMVHGGQQPVVGAQVYLFAAGKAGNGSAASSMLASPGYVLTDSDGGFSINGDYTCNAPTDQVYMAAVGGNPGLASGTNNAALVMVDALGSCGSLGSSTHVYIDEVTTAAAAWALAPFLSSYKSIGATSTNAAGLANAFADAALIADPATGAAPANPPANLTVDTGKLYALADALATCVNSDGATGCDPLFAAATPSGGVAPTNTLNAALNIVANPAQNIAAVFKVISADPPFPTNLTAAPYDWTLSMAVTGGGLYEPTSLDIDAKNDIWVAGYEGELSEFSPQGTPKSGATGFGVGDLNESYGLTIDTNGDIWVSNYESSPNAYGSVSEFDGSSTATPGAVVAGTGGGANFYDSTVAYPDALSADTNGDIFIANFAPHPSATVYTSAGVYVANLGAGNAAFPTALAVDADHGVWLGNYGDDTVTHIDQYGNILSRPDCCMQANGLATDAFGNVWIANYSVSNGGSFSEVASNGDVLINQAVAGGVSYPAGISVDAAQNVWMADYHGESITEIAGQGGVLTPGTAISPSYGYGYSGPTSASPLLSEPYAVIPDRSGNLWVSNYGADNLIVFFGLAAPTSTPTLPVPVAP